MIQVYGIKNCDSVKKALSFFKKNALEYELHDFKEKNASCDDLSRWLSQVDMKTLFNSRSTTYRDLKLKELNLDDEAKKEYLCQHNMLIKRPVLEIDNKILVGYNEELYKKELL